MTSAERYCDRMEGLRREAWDKFPWTDIEIAGIEGDAGAVVADQEDVDFVLAAVNSQAALLRVVRAAEVMLGAPPIEKVFVKAEDDLRAALDALPGDTDA